MNRDYQIPHFDAVNDEKRVNEGGVFLHTYEMTQNVEKPPEPERSSSTGKSDCDSNDDVVVGRVENGPLGAVWSWVKSVLSRQAKKSISDGIGRCGGREKSGLCDSLREKKAWVTLL